MDRVLAAPRAWGPRTELLLVTGLVWLLLACVPIGLGGIGFSWDALNHHFYLGWTAGENRFDLDWLASSYQSYQYPYLYWPAYQLMRLGTSGTVAGLALVSLHMLVVPALWLLARACITERSWYGTAMRTGAVLLAFAGQVVLSLTDTTANDALAACPLVWSVALALLAARPDQLPHWLPPARAVALSGVGAGVAVAFKFSNGPLALLMPLLWCLPQGTVGQRLAHVARGGGWSMAGFLVAYGYWGWMLWTHFGNPMYPFADNLFEGLRSLTGWHQP